MRSAVILAVAGVLMMSHDATARPLAPSSSGESVVAAGNQFAVDLYRRLDREQPGKNLFFSPTSISLALAMAAAGARGQTQAEMAKTLRLDANLAASHAYYRKLLDGWNAAGEKRPYQLRVANRLWGQKGYPIRPEFLELTRQEYGAEMTLLDFVQAQAASQEINQWVEKQTNDKIKDLIEPQALRDARLVLTNAIYFKGDWGNRFDKKNTREEDFTVAAEKKANVPLMQQKNVKVPLMQQKTVFGYKEEETLQVLEMPYAGQELSMVVLLPKSIDGLPDLEKAISMERLAGLLSELPTCEVITFLPKFKLETSFALASTLEALGMKLAFSEQADFSGISGKEDLFISAVVHKAYVDVNEEGTEAAAATAAVCKAEVTPGEPSIPVFRADHPFLFLIRDTRTGAILFLGRVEDPSR
jgi:serpin B